MTEELVVFYLWKYTWIEDLKGYLCLEKVYIFKHVSTKEHNIFWKKPLTSNMWCQTRTTLLLLYLVVRVNDSTRPKSPSLFQGVCLPYKHYSKLHWTVAKVHYLDSNDLWFCHSFWRCLCHNWISMVLIQKCTLA